MVKDKFNFLKSISGLIREYLREDFDFVTCISGLEGCGKSTLSIHLARTIDSGFNIKRNLLFQPTHEEVNKKIYNLPRYSVIILDEAMRIAYSRNAMTRETRMLNVIFSVCRKRNQGIILNIPSFFHLDSYFRNHRVILWFHIVKRGHCFVFKKLKSPFLKDPWFKNENQSLIDKYQRRRVMDDNILIQALRKSKNYVDDFKFPDLPADLKNEYRELAEKEQQKYNFVEPDNKEIALAELINGLRKEDNYSYTKLADKTRFSYEILRKWVNEINKRMMKG